MFPRIHYLLAAAVAMAACTGGRPVPSSETPVILISIDTLRSDHLPVYGYQGVATPNIDRFRQDSILYQHAYAHVPLTLPSHATMLTGVYPAENGLRDNVAFTMRKDIPTLGELLKRQGYGTGAAVSSFVLRRETGIARGFDFYDDGIELSADLHNLGGVQRSGTETTKIASDWIGKQSGKFFFMLHLYEPHTPYQPPEPYLSRYPASLYDGEIAAADQIVGSFLQFLREKNLYDRSLIILLSDHGEGLSDHGEDEHGIFLYREAIQVPLLLKLPKNRWRGKTVTTPVQLTDVFTTVAEQTAATFDRKSIRGESLLSWVDKPGDRQVFAESYYARLHFGWSELHSLIDSRHHFIRAPSPEFYDVATDPDERSNILANHRRTYAAMRKITDALVSEPTAQQNINPEEARKLAALGYLGSPSVADATAVRADPKEKIATVQELKIALGYFQQERDLEALPLFRKLARENPGMLDIWDAMARSLIRLHRYEEAVDAAKHALKISPTTRHFAVLIANASLELNRLEDAEKHAELIRDDEPAQAHEIMARVQLARKHYDQAKREAELALETKRERISTLLTLARIENERNNPPGALAYCDQIASILAEKNLEMVRRLHFNRGDALARMGRHAEAEREFREEIRLFPRDPQPYKNLILLYVTQDRLDEATRLIYELERTAPSPPAYIAIAETLKLVGDAQGSRVWARRGLVRFPDDRRLRSLGQS